MKLMMPPAIIVNSQSLAASFNSPILPVYQADSMVLQVNYTGAPVGSLDVQESLDYNPSSGAGNFVSITPLTQAIPGAVSPILIETSAGLGGYLRIVYTRTSGTGSMSVYMSRKRVGD